MRSTTRPKEPFETQSRPDRDAGWDDAQLSLAPEDLGLRITYLASQPPSETSAPDRDFAVPFA